MQSKPIQTKPKVRRGGHLRQRGDSWVVKYRADGQQVWKSFKSRDQAEVFLANLQVKFANNEDVRAPAKVTFEVAAEAWHANGRHVRGWKPSTARDYRSVLDKWLLPAFRTKRLDEVTAAAIQRWRRGEMQAVVKKPDGTTTPKTSRRTADKLVSVLHSVFEFARLEYQLGTNPAATVERLPVRYDGGRLDFYTPEEVWALVRAAKDDQDATIFLTAAFTGLRRGEVLGLRWRDCDFERQAIRVEHSLSAVDGQLGTTKSGVMRSVPMAPDVAVELAKLNQRQQFTGRDDFVFVNDDGGSLDGSAVRRRFVAAVKAAKLRPLRFHDLRHSFGTIAANAALSTRELQAWLGHADARTTARYTHYRERGDEAARLAKAFTPLPPAVEVVNA